MDSTSGLRYTLENSNAGFPFQICFSDLHPNIFASSFSNNSVAFFDVGKGSLIRSFSLEGLHEKRINEIFIDESVLFSASNDGSVKLTDIRENKLIKTFKSKRKMFLWIKFSIEAFFSIFSFFKTLMIKSDLQKDLNWLREINLYPF